MQVQFELNGKRVEVDVEPRMTLADCIRDKCRQTGTHLGCEHGVCGACTVLVNGEAVRACLILAVQAQGEKIVTIEGLSNDDELTPLQASFRRHHALQCGFCTPGIITTMHALLSEEPNADANRVREVLSGNICRCTGYIPIVEAVLDAQRLRAEELSSLKRQGFFESRFAQTARATSIAAKLCLLPNHRPGRELARLEASQSGDDFMGQSKPLRRTTALVVEDEQEQRFLSATLFEESEFDVVECESAEAAIEVIKERGEDVALVFTDVQLAGDMDGVDLAKAVREELPGVSVIVTSGAGSERLSDLPPGVEFVRKPWRALDLLIKAEKARELRVN